MVAAARARCTASSGQREGGALSREEQAQAAQVTSQRAMMSRDLRRLPDGWGADEEALLQAVDDATAAPIYIEYSLAPGWFDGIDRGGWHHRGRNGVIETPKRPPSGHLRARGLRRQTP